MTLIYTETRVYTGTQKCTHKHMCRLIHTDIGTHRHTYAQTYTGDTHRERCTLSCTHRHTCREPRTDSYTQTLRAHTVHTRAHRSTLAGSRVQTRICRHSMHTLCTHRCTSPDTQTHPDSHTHTLAPVGAVGPPFSANTCHKVCGERM